MSLYPTVRDYLERMVPLETDAVETRDRLNEIKREARSDGLNLDALDALLRILGKCPHDKGSSVLNEVIRYAEAYGTKGLVASCDGGPQASTGGLAGAEVPQLPRATTPPPADASPRGLGSGRLPVWTQVAASLVVSIGLIWLLN